MKLWVVSFLIFLGVSSPAFAQEMATRPISCLAPEHLELTPDDIGFFKDIKTAIETDNREWLANNISWPLVVSLKRVKGWIENKNEFLKYYDQIVTAKVKTAVRKQKPEELFKNYQGVMIGNGDIWFSEQYAPRTQTKICAYSIETIQDAPVYGEPKDRATK
jgi:hypothetical protein